MRSLKRLVVVVGTVCAVVVPLRVTASPPAAVRPPIFHPPAPYYLALGDSLAFGFQEAKFLQELSTGTYDPATFNTGYDADFAAMIRPLAPGGHAFSEVNYGCPGETTASMIRGGCPFHNATIDFRLHNDYLVSASQLQVAIAFLQAHPHQVNPITLDIGANDILNLLSNCNANPTCISNHLAGTIATMRAHLDWILSALRSVAPGAEMLAINVPDPFQFSAPASLPAFAAFNRALDAVVARHGVRLVDAFAAVQKLDEATFCKLSAVCTPPLFDIHPTDAGYAALAQSLWTASGYVLHPELDSGRRAGVTQR
ncbi:MAG: SGNH/GDSL hydrolase family protein [Chloroflexi bacterium]|nr:MAG: SGNH/GDSL hydrolase family protein [Chloroflexota bacterium]